MKKNFRGFLPLHQTGCRLFAVALLLLFATTACGQSSDEPAAAPPGKEQPAETPDDETSGDEPSGDDSCDADDANKSPENDDTMIPKITLAIGSHTFRATLADNATTRAFVKLLPLTLPMRELNGNEKYHDLSTSLPTDASAVQTIHAGDLKLYGSRCVVLFYKTFSSGYSYTTLGALDATEGLEAAVGAGDVEVTFALAE